ncbi:alpha/beta fold hydrolase [Kineococcus siccus]|uniref:alpha/beta fold hydrolase n=1 Tax=Kineococcus siccus TaxID=2696567 RepID=UPI0023F48C95|nr:alpha/beta fold hydrolase [Kineococcus siccus]
MREPRSGPPRPSSTRRLPSQAEFARVGEDHRCVALDLVGTGGSDQLPGTGDDRYRFVEHRRFLDAALTALDLDGPCVFVGHDWRGVLAVDRARRRPDTARGVAYLEAGVVPVSWHDGTGPDRELSGALRSPAGEQLALRRPG